MATKTLISLVVLLSGLVFGIFLVSRSAIFSPKATSFSQNEVSIQNSYLFASPIQAKADGNEKIRLTIFLLDNRGMGIFNQKITLITPPSLQVINTQVTTDDTGKAIFDAVSNLTGTFEVSAEFNNIRLPQKVKITFL